MNEQETWHNIAQRIIDNTVLTQKEMARELVKLAYQMDPNATAIQVGILEQEKGK